MNIDVMPRLFSGKMLRFACAFLVVAAICQTPTMAAEVEHMVIIGCDGMSPDGVQKAQTPNMHQLMNAGAFTMHARGVMPTTSSPNWASMIMGAGPEQHGVTSNDWETNKFEIAPTVRGPGGMFPTIFGVLREQRPAAVIACFHDWNGFGRLFERNAADIIENPQGPTNTTARANAYIKAHKPAFTFIHLDHVDHAGHQFGHGSPEYYQSVEVADKLIGEVIQAVHEAGMWEKTIILVTADHGGVAKGHGGATMAELEIPWILCGPGVMADHELKTPVNTYDTAVTVAYIFGIKPPDCWIGKPVTEAFTISKTTK
jgi:predicted AlkP superfamily pyrophosphatase or phosphodiesterase